MADPKLTSAEKNLILAQKFVREVDIICIGDDFFKYNDGIWEIIQRQEVMARLNSAYIKDWGPTNKTQITEVIRNIQSETFFQYEGAIKKMQEPRNGHINTLLGVLDLKTFKTEPYKREHLAFHRLPFDYIKGEKENHFPPVFAKFLTTSMGFKWDEEKGGTALKECEAMDYQYVMQFIQEWIGYSMLPGNRLHKALIMVGRGRNGKGVLQEVWSHLVGDHNVSRIDLDGVNNPVTVSQTRNKLVNFSYDLQAGQQLDTGTVKAAVAGEWITANEKYKAPYSFQFTAKMIIACNQLPWIKDTGAAVRERFYVLPFFRTFTEAERDPDLKQNIIENELGMIFTWAVDGLKNLLKRGYFIEPNRCKKALEQYMVDNDSVAQWIFDDELNVADPMEVKHAKAGRKELWRNYKDWCQDSGCRAYKKSTFFEKLREQGYKEQRTNTARYFIGLRLPNQVMF